MNLHLFFSGWPWSNLTTLFFFFLFSYSRDSPIFPWGEAWHHFERDIWLSVPLHEERGVYWISKKKGGCSERIWDQRKRARPFQAHHVSDTFLFEKHLQLQEANATMNMLQGLCVGSSRQLLRRKEPKWPKREQRTQTTPLPFPSDLALESISSLCFSLFFRGVSVWVFTSFKCRKNLSKLLKLSLFSFFIPLLLPFVLSWLPFSWHA